MNQKYEVVVGNVGKVLSTNNKAEAIKCYKDYVSISQVNKYSRAYGEDVYLFEKGDLIKEHTGHIEREV